MAVGKRNHATALEIRLLREGIVESVHETHAVVCDERGRVLSARAGDSPMYQPAVVSFRACNACWYSRPAR